MQSRTSFFELGAGFNKTLFRKNMTRYWPLWGMATFIGALFPLALVMNLLRYPVTQAPTALELTEIYYEVVCYGVPIISLVYAILCAMAVWGYLYNARSVGLMHTLPIERKGLMMTNFLSGMAMMLIPYVVTGGLMILISLAYGCFDPVGVLTTILSVLGLSFFYFSSATFVAFVTGNVFGLPALYFIFHFLAVTLDMLVSVFAQGFILGLNGGYSGAVNYLSPTVYLMSKLGVHRERVEVAVPGQDWTEYQTVAVEPENFWLIGVYVLVGVVLLTLAWQLYRRRRSESAGDVVAVGWMKPVFRYGVALCAALSGGQALYAITWQNFRYGKYYEVLPLIVCAIIAGVIGYYGASMLLAKSLRVFRRSGKGVAVVAVCCAALCLVLELDILGVATRVPEIDNVTQVELYAGDNNYVFYPGEEDELLEQVRRVHLAIAEDAEYIKALEDDNTIWTKDEGSDEEYASTYVRLEYTLKSGITVSRRYNIPVNRGRMKQEGTYDYLLNQLINSEAMKTKRLRLNDERTHLANGSLWTEWNHVNYDLSSREAAGVLEAVNKDAAAGTWGIYDWFWNDRRADRYAIDLTLYFNYRDEEEGSSWIESITIHVYPDMEHTVNCLLELGLFTREQMLTYGQLYPEEYPGYVEKYGVTAEAVSVGIIGGADGPTEVFVAGMG